MQINPCFRAEARAKRIWFYRLSAPKVRHMDHKCSKKERSYYLTSESLGGTRKRIRIARNFYSIVARADHEQLNPGKY